MNASRVGRRLTAGAVFATLVAIMMPGGTARAATADLAWLDDRAAVHQFVDGVMALQIARGETVGATVSITRGNDLVMAQGYGLADRAAFRAVDAEQTLFRIGSVSKVFVWMAVMQQVAAGRLDLNADINSYLRTMQVPYTYPQPITLTHLMTHTAGFEDKLIGLFAYGPMTVGDFHSNLIASMPRRIMIPGHFAAYSNYGTALAAHLVEIAAGEDWDAYVDGHILKPLAMSSTTTQQPVPKALTERVSSGYFIDDGRFVKAPFEFVTIPPAASVTSTAPDMARLMIELLGHYDSTVLPAAARAQLYASGYQHDPRLNRMLYGFYEQNSHGEKLVGHAGDTLAFHSLMLLCPELDLGLFVSYNSEGTASNAPTSSPRGKARGELVEAFLDRLFGRPNLERNADKGFDATRYVGFYTSLRAPSSGHDKIASLVYTLQVSADTDGHLMLSSEHGPRRFVKVDDNLFEEDAGTERLVFHVEGEAATQLYLDSMPMIDFARVPPGGNPLLHIGVIVAALVLGGAAWLVWPLSSFAHRGRIGVRGETGATLLALLNAGLIIGFAFVVGGAAANLRDLAFGLPKSIADSLWIPIALVPLLLLQVLYAVRAFVGDFWWPARVIHYALLTLAAIVFVAWAFYWHLTAVIVDL